MGPSWLLTTNPNLVGAGCVDLGVEFQFQAIMDKSALAEVNKLVFVLKAVGICWKA